VKNGSPLRASFRHF